MNHAPGAFFILFQLSSSKMTEKDSAEILSINDVSPLWDSGLLIHKNVLNDYADPLVF